MKPPKSVKIGPYVYKVSTKKADLDRQDAARGRQCDGTSNVSRQFLGVRTTDITSGEPIGDDYQRSTLLHEVLHQCLAVMACDLDTEFGGAPIEERAVSALELSLYQTLRENPDLIAYLTEGTSNG